MRFDTMVSFWSETGSHYDPDAGETVQSKKLVASILANVTDLGTDRAQQILGSYTARAQVARLTCPAPAQWDYCLIGSNPTRYRLETSRTPLHGNTIILGEDGG